MKKTIVPKILIVDDSRSILLFLEKMLTGPGLEIIKASSGKEALLLLNKHDVALILMDVQMPGMDGFEAAELMRGNEATKYTPIVFMTASGQKRKFVFKGYEIGAVDFLFKPLEPEVLKSKVQVFLQLFRQKKKLEETNEALKQEKKKAEEANKAKSLFLANMSHEFRTPLNAILGYAQILKRDKDLGPSQKSGIGMIEDGGNHLLNLVNDILDLSKIEAKKIEIRESAFRLHDFLDNVAAMCGLQAREKGLSFQKEIIGHLPSFIYTDERRLRQILLNLLGNAVKFTQKGGVTLEVSSSRSKLRFRVEDTGIGIPSDRLEEIFSPFKQVGKHTRTIEGTGLGLSISRKLARLMGSDLHVKSSVGKGTAFWFDLELQDTAQSMRPEAVEQNITGFKGDKRKILVVDDHWRNRAFLTDLLEPLGFEMAEAKNGRAGVYKALAFKPDVILMDLVMPGMDGFESARRIRQSALLKHVKIIAVSASTPEFIINDSLPPDCDDFIAKPVKADVLFDKLAAHLGLEWIGAEPGETVEPAGLEDEKNFVLLPPPEAKEVYTMAMRGDILNLQKYLDGVGQPDKPYAPFVKELQGLARGFRVNLVREFVQKHLGDLS